MENDEWLKHIENESGEPIITIRKDVFFHLLQLGNFGSFNIEHKEKMDQPNTSSITFKKGGGSTYAKDLFYKFKGSVLDILHGSIEIILRDASNCEYWRDSKCPAQPNPRKGRFDGGEVDSCPYIKKIKTYQKVLQTIDNLERKYKGRFKATFSAQVGIGSSCSYSAKIKIITNKRIEELTTEDIDEIKLFLEYGNMDK